MHPTARRSDRARARCVLAGLLSAWAVSAFAQSHGERWWDAPARPAAQTNTLTLAAHGTLRAYQPETAVEGDAVLPSNLNAPGTFRSLLDEMLRRSPAFRRQCRRIALARDLRIVVRPTLVTVTGVRARTHLLTTSEGLVAVIDLVTMNDAVELIAHEIEHVIERLDGVDLRHQAALPRTGVHVCVEGSFETLRAQRMGRLVAAEARGSTG